MRRTHHFLIVIPTLLGLSGILAGQAMIGHSMGSARAGVSTATTQNVGKAVGGIANKLDRALQGGPEPSVFAPNDRGTSSARSIQFTKVPAFASFAAGANYEDPGAIHPGMVNDELLRRFGPPALQVTGAPTGFTWTYSRTERVVQLDMRGEKVGTVNTINPHQAAVVLPTRHGLPGFH